MKVVDDPILQAWIKLDQALQDEKTSNDTPKGSMDVSSLKPIISKINAYRPASRESRLGEMRFSHDLGAAKPQFIIRHQTPQKRRSSSIQAKGNLINSARPTTPSLARADPYASMNMTLFSTHSRVVMTSRLASGQVRLDRFSPKSKYFDDTAILHSVSVSDLTEIYENKCIDNKTDSNSNQLKHFLDKFNKICKKRVLNLEEQSIGPNATIKVAEILKTNNHFVRLNLSRNFIGDDGAKALAEALKQNDTIIHVDLCSDNIGPEGSAAIFKMLLVNKTIVSLKLNSHEGLFRNRIDARGMKHITSMLQKNKVLTFLNLAGSCITPAGAEYLAEGIRGNTTLMVLDISNNDLGPNTATILAKSLPYSNIKEFYIADNHLGDKGVNNLVQMFLPVSERLAQLEVLDLSNNKINPYGAGKVFDALAKNGTVQKLILNRNNLSGKGILSLVNFLWDNCSVQHLSLAECEMGIEGAEALSSGLLRNKSVKTLNIGHNRFKDQGIKILCKGLSENYILKNLDLSCCMIHNEGGKYLSDLLKKNHTLEVIELKDNTFYDEVGQFLVDSIKYNKQLIKISLERNPMSYKYVAEIYKLIQIAREENLRENAENFEKQLEELRHFEHEKFGLNDEKYEIQEKTKEVREELKKEQELFEKLKQEEEAKYAELEAEYNLLWNEMRKLDEIWDHQYDQAKNLANEVADYAQFVNVNNGKLYAECQKVQEEIKLISEECDLIRAKYEKEILKLKKEIEAEESRIKYQEMSINTIKNQIQRFKDASRRDLHKALEEISSIKEDPPEKKPTRKSTASKTASRKSIAVPSPEKRDLSQQRKNSISIKGVPGKLGAPKN